MFFHADYYEDPMIIFPPVSLCRGRPDAKRTNQALNPVTREHLDRVAPLSKDDEAHLRDDDITPAVHSHIRQRIMHARIQRYGS